MYSQARTRDDDFRALVTARYGLPHAPARPASTAPPRVVALSADTGTEILDPASGAAAVEEYVVDRPELPWPDVPAALRRAEASRAQGVLHRSVLMVREVQNNAAPGRLS